MSIYGSLLADKTTIVLDIGAKYTKLGCAGEFSPKIIIPTAVRCPSTGREKYLFHYEDDVDLKSMLIEFIHLIHFKYILISPKDKPIVIVESLLSPIKFKDLLAEVLFTHFEVGSLLFVPSPLVSLYGLGLKTALVVDIGYSEVQVIPVYELVPILHAWQAQPIAAQAVESKLRDTLKTVVKELQAGTKVPENLPEIDDLTDSDIEDIKVRGCFVTTVERGRLLSRGETLPNPCPPSMLYPVKGCHILPIPGKVRESAFELLFERDNDNLALPNLIIDSILKCSMDCRKELCENLLVIGGTAMATGLRARLMEELREAFASPEYQDRVPSATLKIHSPPAKENYVAWLGGSLVGATELVNMKALTREKYASLHCVPDWSNLAHNDLYLSKCI